MLRTLCLLFFCCLLLWAGSLPVLGAASDARYKVALRTVGISQPARALRMDINVWYPGIRPQRALDYPPWTLYATRNGKAVAGRFPLILLSHASPATRFSYHDTAAWLASCGFVVAAPTHNGDCLHDMSLRFTWQQLLSRSVELSAVIDALLNDADLTQSIDPQRIGLLGYGAGGTAALLLGGALPACTDWPQWCAQTDPQDEYCNHWGRERITALCRSLPLRHSLADPRIRAIAAVSPGFGMLFGPESFRYFYPPLLLIGGGKDRANPPALHSRAIANHLREKARYINLPDADQGAFMAPCPADLFRELPELCRPISRETRQKVHQTLQNALADFFLYYLGSTMHLPQIPEPPEAPAWQPPAADPPSPTRQGRRRP